MGKTKTSGRTMDTNDKDKKGIVEKYTRTPYPSLVKPEPTEAEETDDNKYRALIEHREKKAILPDSESLTVGGNITGAGMPTYLGGSTRP